jgi:RNA polymerase subunit RPABC4/transcription elongation factor Spt4
MIACNRCGNDLSWDEDLCQECIDALFNCEWSQLITSLGGKYYQIIEQVRSLYPDFDQLDEGWGL